MHLHHHATEPLTFLRSPCSVEFDLNPGLQGEACEQVWAHQSLFPQPQWLVYNGFTEAKPWESTQGLLLELLGKRLSLPASDAKLLAIKLGAACTHLCHHLQDLPDNEATQRKAGLRNGDGRFLAVFERLDPAMSKAVFHWLSGYLKKKFTFFFSEAMLIRFLSFETKIPLNSDL